MPNNSMNFSVDLIPSTTNTYNLGTSSAKWIINGTTNPVLTDTTYTFTNGTNGFTVTPAGGSAQTVTVTPSITNNVTGSGTSGYLAKFNGVNTITSGPQLGSSTTTFLRNDGSWATPSDTLNTAGSTNSTSKLFLIGATAQTANPTTNSYQYTYVTEGVLSSTKFNLNATGTSKATIQWNATDNSIDFIFD